VVNLWLSALLVVVAVGVTTSLMLLVRTRAPAGGFFSDSDRAAAVFGFIGTAFAVLLAFVIFLAFETYTGAKTEAAHEADAVFEQFEIAQLFEPADRDRLQSQLVCYARSVVSDEWDSMRDGERSDRVDAWVIEIEHSIDAVSLDGPRQTVGFDKFFDETIAREDGRRGRLQEAAGVVPAPMWFMLLLGAACLLGYMLLFADSAERLLVQCVLIGAVTVLVVTPLLLIDFLDHPYKDSTGSIMPTSMRFTLDAMEHEREATIEVPCTADGAPTGAQAAAWR
jgi:hypothetical protein